MKGAIRRFAAAGALVALAACRRAPSDATPEGAVREVCERLESAQASERDAEAVYRLLSQRARANLQARAERFGSASGRPIDPWAMLVAGRSRPRFAPQEYRARVAGAHALVEVLGAGAGQRAYVPCVREKGAWHVDLALPELPLLRQR